MLHTSTNDTMLYGVLYLPRSCEFKLRVHLSSYDSQHFIPLRPALFYRFVRLQSAVQLHLVTLKHSRISINLRRIEEGTSPPSDRGVEEIVEILKAATYL